MIKLSQIRMETSFRNKERDLSLELSISRHGLKVPLIVEQVSKNQYILVDGHRRFYALDFLGGSEVECIVEELSSEEERIIKRLEMELHSKRRTSYQLERMVNRLLENERYNINLIASMCNVTEGTITKYIHGSNVNSEWLRRGERNGVGRHAFTDIHNLNVNIKVKNEIAERYINKECSKGTVELIKKATKEKAFGDIPDENIINCIDEIIKLHSKNYEDVKEIVIRYSLQASYNESSHTFLFGLTVKMLTKVIMILSNSNYAKYLTNMQKEELTNCLQEIQKILTPPLNWSEFPKEQQLFEKVEEENNDSFEH